MSHFVKKSLQFIDDLRYQEESKGVHINDRITNGRDFANPYAVKDLMSHYGIDEYASNFEPGVYDPRQYVELKRE